MERRRFLHLTGLGLGGAMLLPVLGTPVTARGATPPLPADRRALADAALDAATDAGAAYADVRIGRTRNQFIITQGRRVDQIVDTESYGAGVRVLVAGTWGFAATHALTKDAIVRATRQAVAIAQANARLQAEPVRLAPVAAHGAVTWRTPIETNAFEVPLAEKIDLLLGANATATDAGADFVTSALYLIHEQKYFASTEGTYADQDLHRIHPDFTVTAVDPRAGTFATRTALSAPMGLGWEYLDDRAAPVHRLVTPVYGDRYNLREDIRMAARQAREKLRAPSVHPGQYDLVLDPSHLWLTIHESVGHPLELDRVLGYEANYAGTSFASLDKWRSGTFRYGSERVNFFADKTQPGALAACGYDDEGVRTKRWDLVRDGVLVNYQATREQAHLLGEDASHGCSYADSWSSVQFQRMPNVSLEPSPEAHSVEDVIGGVERGIYVLGNGSYSIDQQRYNFQFGGQLYYEIRDGRLAGMLRDVAYQSDTVTFWNACADLADARDYRLGGSLFDGKGQPGQVSAVSHGCPTARFNDIDVLNTAI